MTLWNTIRLLVPLCMALTAGQLSAQYLPSTTTNDYAGNDVSATGTPIPFAASSLAQSESVSLPSGFNFDFYGNRYTDVWVSNSGLVTFGTSSVGPFPPASLPDAAAPNNAIYACQTSLIVDTAVGDGVWTERLSSPDRFVIHWKAKHTVTNEQADFVMVLFPNDTIEVHFGPTTTLAGGHSSLPPGMGIENGDGTVGEVPPGGYRQAPTTTTAFRYELPPVDLDVVDVVPEPSGPFPAPYDVHVVVKNHGSQSFTGSIDVEYSADGATPFSQNVTLTNFVHDEQAIVTFTGGLSWVVTPGSHNFVGAINPPATGDPDAPDELNVQFEVDSQSYYGAYSITNDYAANDITTTGTLVPHAGNNDSQSVSFPAGFEFPYFGRRYDRVWVSTNGVLNFGSVGQLGHNPAEDNGDNAIYACQADLVVDTAGNGVWTQRLSSPDRFVVHWLAEHLHTGDRADFVAILYPDGTTETHFGPTTTIALGHSDLPPGMGIENADGTVLVEVPAPGGYQQVPTPTTAYRFELPQVDLDIVDVHAVGPHLGPNEIQVEIGNHGSQPFSGTLNIEYSVNGGTPETTGASITNLRPGERFMAVFGGSGAWDIPGSGSYTVDVSIDPPATDDPDDPDKFTRVFDFDATSYYRTSIISNNFAANDIAATGTQIPFGVGTHPAPEFINLPAGFEFPFYGARHSGVWVNSSGLLDFSGNGSSLPASVRVTPTPTVPDPAELNNVIYACQTRLRYDQAGQGAWTQLLTGPDRFVIHYRGRHFTLSNGTAEFAVVLYPTGAIEIHFAPTTTLGGADALFPPAMGIENPDGTVGLAAPRGWRQFPTPTTAYRYELPTTDLDVVDVFADPTSSPPAGPTDVHVVILNNGAQSFTGNVDVEYAIDGGAPVTQTVSITNLLPSQRHTAVFTGAKSWDVAAGFHDVRGAINPPVAGDPDAVDEFIVQDVKGGGAWTQQAATGHWSPRTGHSTVVFNGKIWVMGGGGSLFSPLNDVWSSPDGVNWTQETAAAPWPARTLHASAVFNNEIWVVGGIDFAVGDYNDVWSSPDGVNWTQHAATGHWSARLGLQALVFDNRLWVLGGHSVMSNAALNDVWSTDDGVNWVQESAAAGWAPRGYNDPVVFDSRMWVIGGSDDLTDGMTDVWSSSDGVNWTQETAAAPWTRFTHTTAVFNDRIWMLGGRHAGESANDVWSSPDGANWVRETESAPWSKRNGHTSAVFNDRLWVLGGGGGSGANNEVWSYIEAPQIMSSPPATAIVGNLYTYDVVVSTAATTFTASGLPPWLTFSGNTLSGTPGPSDVGLTGTITITATNAEGTFDQEFQIDVQGLPPQITSTPVETAAVNVPYTYTVTATGVPAPTLSASGLPPWASFDSNTGELAGTPGTGDYGTSSTVTITAANGWAPDAVQTFTINVPSLTDGNGDSDNGGCAGSTGGPATPVAMLALLLGAAMVVRCRRPRCSSNRR